MYFRALEEKAESTCLAYRLLRIPPFWQVPCANIVLDLNIKSVISIAESGFLVNKSEEIVNYLYIPAEDHESYNIKQHFDETYHFI